MVLTSKRLYLLIPPLFASLIGLWAAKQNEIPVAVFLPNFAAIIWGAPLLFYSQKISRFVTSRVLGFSIFSCLLLDLCFFGPGIDGVQRWISLGSIQLNVAMALLPLCLFILSRLDGVKMWAFGFAITALLILQPDAGQTTAWAFATLLLFLLKRNLSLLIRLAGSLTVMTGALVAWTRPDPLLPVDHVERILHLLFALGEGEILAMAIAIIGLFGPLLWKATQKPSPPHQPLILSFLAWLFVSFLVTAFGNFPVPVIGAGAAPVLGWFLMMTLIDDSPKGHKDSTATRG